jgi:membrane peptidoglycan carboxypeptidase
VPDAPRPRLEVLVRLLLAVLTAGALAAGMVSPWVIAPALAARQSADLLTPIASTAVDRTLGGNTVVLAADGSPITYFYANNRIPLRSDQISPYMKAALVDIEDSRFYEHGGIDLQGTLRALLTNLASGGVNEGGSTLTQQLVKQTLLQTAQTSADRAAATEQSIGRKLREARYALALEQEYSKDEILTRYLNVAYFGEGAYGVQAAARTYFDVDAANLTIPQAAMLAGLVQSPTSDDPLQDPEAARLRRNEVLTRMEQLHHITAKELADLSSQPVAVAPGGEPPNGCTGAGLAGFFCDYVQSYLTATLHIPQSVIDGGGLTIKTTLLPALESSAQNAVLGDVPMGNPIAGVFTAVAPDTGHVLAMAVNRKFGYDSNDPAQESVNYNVAPAKGSGSTYKLFTAAAALERGIPPWNTITTSDPYTSKVYKNNGGPYVVHNAGQYPATLTLANALVMSSNTYFVALEDQLGSVQGPVGDAQKMGLFQFNDPALPGQILSQSPGPFTLGFSPTSPLALASAYSTVANNGTHCAPTPVTAILDIDGQPLKKDDGTAYDTGDHCTPNTIPAAVATTLDNILVGDVSSSIGTATRAAIPGHTVAGKTGTNELRDSIAFVGWTPRYTASVMVLDPVGNRDVGTYGGGRAAQIWHDAFAPILAGEPNVAFPPPGIPLTPPAPPRTVVVPAPAPAPVVITVPAGRPGG